MAKTLGSMMVALGVLVAADYRHMPGGTFAIVILVSLGVQLATGHFSDDSSTPEAESHE